MPSNNSYQEIYKLLGEPLALAGRAASDYNPEGDENRLFLHIYEAQSIAATLGWGDELEWGEVAEEE